MPNNENKDASLNVNHKFHIWQTRWNILHNRFWRTGGNFICIFFSLKFFIKKSVQLSWRRKDLGST